MTPVVLLTGFLGSGKTTLLQRLLTDPSMAGAAVLINEFGEVGLDHHLLDRIDDNVVLLKSGCICCTVRGEVADALSNLNTMRASGEIAFDRVVIETTGLADPYPVLQTLTAHPVLRSHFVNGGVLTTVDAVNASLQVEHRAEAVRQIAAADRIVLTKTDLATPEQISNIRARLLRINSAARSVTSDLDVPTILGGFGPATFADTLSSDHVCTPTCGHDHHHHGHHHHDADLDVTSFSLVIDGAIDWTMFGTWLTLLLHKHGDRIFRVKGILALEGEDRPIAIHGVQHLVHAPTHMDHWPAGPRQSRLVFIMEGISPDAIRRSFTAFTGLADVRGRGVTGPLRILTTEIQPWRFLKERAEADLGFPLEFIETDFNSAQRMAALEPDSYDVYDQCFHNLDIVWYWRAVQPIETKRISQWDNIDPFSRISPPNAGRNLGDVPASRLYVQQDLSLSDVPSARISMLPTFYNFDSFAVNAADIDMERDIRSWAALLDPKWAGQVALVDEPAIGLFDLALALSASGQMTFENIGNMSVQEIDGVIDRATSLVQSGHLSPFWLRASDPVDRFLSGELKLASIWSPTLVEMKRQGLNVRQAHPTEGYRAWHGGMCLSRCLSGATLDRAYDWLNWYLDGPAGAIVARQGYYMSVPDRVKECLPKADWDYWYEGLPAAEPLNDVEGHIAIPKGHVRSGGSRTERAHHIALWNTTMDEHNYVVRRWNELVTLASSKTRPNRRAS